MTENGHRPVLPTEVIEYLDAGRAGVYIDCTLGLAGHASLILAKNPKNRLIGLDRDGLSLKVAQERLRPFADRVTLFQADFKDLSALDIPGENVRGVLADLGISSFQLDNADRGFSYQHEGPLDMRADQRLRTTAAKVLHTYPEQRLAEMFARYGELAQTQALRLLEENPFAVP